MTTIITSTVHCDLADKLMSARDDAGLSQCKVAELMDVVQSTVSKIENRTNEDMTIGNLVGYLKACGLRLQLSFIP